MICNKCANIFDDSIPLCPECGAPAFDNKGSFVVNISDEDFDMIEKTEDDGAKVDPAKADVDTETEDTAIFDSTDEDEVSADNAEDSSDYLDEDASDGAVEDIGEEATDSADEDAAADEADDDSAEKKTDSELTEEIKFIPERAATEPKKKPQSEKSAVKTEPKKTETVRKASKIKENKQEKTARNFIVCLASVMGAVLIALCIVGFATDVFKKDDGVKAVALLGLSSDEEKSLEKHLSSASALVDTGFDSNKTTTEEFLGIIHPGVEYGVFKAMGKTAQYITDVADPADRFALLDETNDGEKQYSYYKTEKWQIDSVLDAFGIEPNYTLNSKRCYYYDGFYYFSCEDCDTPKAPLAFDVTDSKRIQDGSYYAVCSALNTADSTARDVYVIAEKITDENEGRSWKITKIQSEPVFDNLGIMIDTSKSGEYSYEMKYITFDAVTKDDKTFCQYTVEYPVFSGDTNGEAAANALYESIVSSYKAQAEKADEDYKKYKKDGYDDGLLPMQVHFTADVSYSKGEYIGVINEIAKTSPVKKTAEDSENQENTEEKKIIFAEKSLEGYTFDALTGEYVTKDAIIGKEYLKISELLYRLYFGYDYFGIMTEENAYGEVPEDTDETGKHFYDGASTLSEDGYVFCAVSEDGYTEKVVIPFDTQGVFTKTF